MASATYRSNGSPYTTLTLNIFEIAKDGNLRTFQVEWVVSLGSETGLGLGNPRTLSIYKSDGTLCGQSQIKSSSDVWEASKEYRGSFNITIDVGTTDSGLIYLYGMTNTSDFTSCTWNNRSYCTDIEVVYSLSTLPTLLLFNGQPVTKVAFNCQSVTNLILNGNTIF